MLSDVNSVNNFNEDENLNEFKKYHPFIYTDAYIPKTLKFNIQEM